MYAKGEHVSDNPYEIKEKAKFLMAEKEKEMEEIIQNSKLNFDCVSEFLIVIV